MIRATTGGVLRSYRANLMKSFITDNKARETVLTQRIFNSYAEDPATAAKAFRLRKSRIMTSSQLKICDDTLHKYQGAFASLQTISQLIDTENSSSDVSTLKDAALRMLNDPTGDARVQLNKVLDNLSDTIIQNMNQTYGDEFIFAGADGHNVPFTVEEVDGHKQLYYRGVPVDAAVPELMKDENEADLTLDDGRYVLASATIKEELSLQPDGVAPNSFKNYYMEDGTRVYLRNPAGGNATGEGGFIALTDEDGNDTGTFWDPEDIVSADEYDAMIASAIKKEDGTTPDTVEIDGKTYFVVDNDKAAISKEDYDKAKLNAEKLDYLANEKRFVDIGLGFQEDETGKLIESSAFNESLSGLTFLGYGMDEDGDPKNIYSIVQRLKDLAASAPDEGKWSKELYDEFDRMVGKLEDASSEFKTQFTNQSAGVQKLENSYDLLEDNVYSLKEQYSNLEDVNMADAISSFLWAEYCYNAALKVGNSVLSQSLMDYLS